MSWSLHDREVVRTRTRHGAFRYRNAIPTAKRWRRGKIGSDGQPVRFAQNDLQSYLGLIGFSVPVEVRHGAGKWIATVRQRLAGARGDPRRLSQGGQMAWQNLLEHNRLDVLGLRSVVRVATGLDAPGPGGRSARG